MDNDEFEMGRLLVLDAYDEAARILAQAASEHLMQSRITQAYILQKLAQAVLKDKAPAIEQLERHQANDN